MAQPSNPDERDDGGREPSREPGREPDPQDARSESRPPDQGAEGSPPESQQSAAAEASTSSAVPPGSGEPTSSEHTQPEPRSPAPRRRSREVTSAPTVLEAERWVIAHRRQRAQEQVATTPLSDAKHAALQAPLEPLQRPRIKAPTFRELLQRLREALRPSGRGSGGTPPSPQSG